MSLQQTVSAERVHIALFGKRNAGKSSLINALTGQPLAVVSPVAGTTTDPVKKAMELLPLGPVVMIDTPGFDDSGELGEMRVQKTTQILSKTDIALLVTEGDVLDAEESAFVNRLKQRNIPYIIVFNKAERFEVPPKAGENEIYVSALTGLGLKELKEMLGALAKDQQNCRRIVGDMLQAGDQVILVTPIDAAAPKGRLILPQQQTLRDILDAHASASVCQVEQLADVLNNCKKAPRLVITDSQAFATVAKIVPADLPLTSFSILFARYKGQLETQVRGAAALSALRDGDKVLISEGCTHHRQCGDIGTQKMPRWIEEFTDAKPQFSFTSGGEFPENLSEYKLVVHCGGCMLTETEMQHRTLTALSAGVPIVNYGVAIAHMHGILRRALQPLGQIVQMLDFS